jgi:translation initiation factor IF-2
MNVTELARQLKVPTSEFLEILPELGFDIGAKAIKIDDSLIDKIKAAYKKYQKKIKFAEAEAKVEEIKIDEKEEVKEKVEKIIEIGDTIVVKELAEKMELPINKVMTELMNNGVMISLNSDIDFETAAIISEDLGFSIKKVSNDKKEIESEKEKVEKLNKLLAADKNSQVKIPVVVVMGHVDHGKTKLLDTIRKANIIDTEAGNITQHIGAYKAQAGEREITFLDTPGHEAFKAMRSRGTKIADIGIVVVAADEGLKPQTIESIELAQKEKLPFIIAINKIDKETADVEKVKKELSEINLVPEDWGGKTICVEISAKNETNIDGLLEMVNIVTDMENLQADAGRKAIGTIIESHIDQNQGPVASVLIQTGTLKLGDEFISGSAYGKVRAMIDHLGNNLDEAGPSTPIRILGFKNTPEIGDIFNADVTTKEIKELKKRGNKTVSNKTGFQNQNSDDDEENTKSINIILKTDVIGSQEAIIESLEKIKHEEIKIKIVRKGLGSINDKDVIDAETTNATILGFHVNNDANAELLAKEKEVSIKNYKIIYKLLEDIEEKINKIATVKIVREQVGELKVLAVFKTSTTKVVFGGKVLKGKMVKDAIAKIIRDKEAIALGRISNLQSGKENVTEVVAGQECGLEFDGDPVIKEGDLVEIYKEIKK